MTQNQNCKRGGDEGACAVVHQNQPVNPNVTQEGEQ